MVPQIAPRGTALPTCVTPVSPCEPLRARIGANLDVQLRRASVPRRAEERSVVRSHRLGSDCRARQLVRAALPARPFPVSTIRGLRASASAGSVPRVNRRPAASAPRPGSLRRPGYASPTPGRPSQSMPGSSGSAGARASPGGGSRRCSWLPSGCPHPAGRQSMPPLARLHRQPAPKTVSVMLTPTTAWWPAQRPNEIEATLDIYERFLAGASQDDPRVEPGHFRKSASRRLSTEERMLSLARICSTYHRDSLSEWPLVEARIRFASGEGGRKTADHNSGLLWPLPPVAAFQTGPHRTTEIHPLRSFDLAANKSRNELCCRQQKREAGPSPAETLEGQRARAIRLQWHSSISFKMPEPCFWMSQEPIEVPRPRAVWRAPQLPPGVNTRAQRIKVRRARGCSRRRR